jgi:hypothetical protein
MQKYTKLISALSNLCPRLSFAYEKEGSLALLGINPVSTSNACSFTKVMEAKGSDYSFDIKTGEPCFTSQQNGANMDHYYCASLGLEPPFAMTDDSLLATSSGTYLSHEIPSLTDGISVTDEFPDFLFRPHLAFMETPPVEASQPQQFSLAGYPNWGEVPEYKQFVSTDCHGFGPLDLTTHFDSTGYQWSDEYCIDPEQATVQLTGWNLAGDENHNPHHDAYW